jgi:hypothetical protein
MDPKYSVHVIYSLILHKECPQLEELDVNGQLLSEDSSGQFSACVKLVEKTGSRVKEESKKKSGCIVS